MEHKIIRLALITVGILLIPFIAMQFTSEVNWGPEDFIVMGLLIFVIGFAYEVIAHNMKTTSQKVIVATVLALVLAVIWVDLAVGIFNIPGISGS